MNEMVHGQDFGTEGIAPHRGPYNDVLRLHPGLIVPEVSERLAIRVANLSFMFQQAGCGS